MKVLFVHDHKFVKINNSFFSPGGLPSKAWERYLEHFDEIVVIARDDTQNYKGEKVVESSMKDISFNLLKLKNKNDFVKHKKTITSEITEAIKNTDAVIVRLPSELGNFAINIAKKNKTPYAVEVVACTWDALWNYGSIFAKLYAPFSFLKMRKNVRDSKFVIYVTKYFLQKRYPTNGFNSHASNVIIPANSDKSLTFKNKDDKIISIGQIGNLNTKYKGFDITLKALAILKEDFEFIYKIVGPGNNEYLKNLARNLDLIDRVEFIGALPSGNQVYDFLDSIDIYVQPSKQEGLPRALIEAMSRGCFALGARTGGIPELINRRCIHKPGSIEEFSRHLKKAFDDEEWRKEQAMMNYNNAKEYYDTVLKSKRFKFWKSFYDFVESTKKTK